MSTNTNQEKFQFWIKWTLLSALIIPLSYIISLIAVLIVHGAFGFTMDDWGTHLSNTLMLIAGGAVLGFGTGILQKMLLKERFTIPSFWVYSVIIGFVLAELIAGIILWRLDILRGQLNVVNSNNPFPEALIFASAGLIIGLFQWTVLKRYFKKSAYWVFASMLGWGICIVATIFSDWAFVLGALLYGAITGATLLWVLQPKEIKL
jgi:hypothetical protein